MVEVEAREYGTDKDFSYVDHKNEVICLLTTHVSS